VDGKILLFLFIVVAALQCEG